MLHPLACSRAAIIRVGLRKEKRFGMACSFKHVNHDLPGESEVTPANAALAIEDRQQFGVSFAATANPFRNSDCFGLGNDRVRDSSAEADKRESHSLLLSCQGWINGR